MTLINYIYRILYFLINKRRIKFTSWFDFIFSFDDKRYSLEYESLVGDYNIEVNPNNIFLLLDNDTKQSLNIIEKRFILLKAIEELKRMGLKVDEASMITRNKQ